MIRSKVKVYRNRLMRRPRCRRSRPPQQRALERLRTRRRRRRSPWPAPQHQKREQPALRRRKRALPVLQRQMAKPRERRRRRAKAWLGRGQPAPQTHPLQVPARLEPGEKGQQLEAGTGRIATRQTHQNRPLRAPAHQTHLTSTGRDEGATLRARVLSGAAPAAGAGAPNAAAVVEAPPLNAGAPLPKAVDATPPALAPRQG